VRERLPAGAACVLCVCCYCCCCCFSRVAEAGCATPCNARGNAGVSLPARLVPHHPCLARWHVRSWPAHGGLRPPAAPRLTPGCEHRCHAVRQRRALAQPACAAGRMPGTMHPEALAPCRCPAALSRCTVCRCCAWSGIRQRPLLTPSTPRAGRPKSASCPCAAACAPGIQGRQCHQLALARHRGPPPAGAPEPFWFVQCACRSCARRRSRGRA